MTAKKTANANTSAVTIDLGNNESASRGIFLQADGTFLAMTFTQSKSFKTRSGAERWIARKLNAGLDAMPAEPFCACGRRISQCDGSRKGCGK